jgi:colanic acid biosynthesis glycosyl transferase WcaI
VVEGRAACGRVVPPEDAAAFASALRDLLASDADRARMGANGRAFAERELEKDAVLGAFEREAMELVGLQMRGATQ